MLCAQRRAASLHLHHGGAKPEAVAAAVPHAGLLRRCATLVAAATFLSLLLVAVVDATVVLEQDDAEAPPTFSPDLLQAADLQPAVFALGVLCFAAAFVVVLVTSVAPM